MKGPDVLRRELERVDLLRFHAGVGFLDLLRRYLDVLERELHLVELLGELEHGRVAFLPDTLYDFLDRNGNFFGRGLAAVDDALQFGCDIFLL